jgi:hypothetical protein
MRILFVVRRSAAIPCSARSTLVFSATLSRDQMRHGSTMAGHDNGFTPFDSVEKLRESGFDV